MSTPNSEDTMDLIVPETTDATVVKEEAAQEPVSPAETPVETPKKRGRKKATATTATDENAEPESSPKKTKASPSKKSLGPIPTSFEAAGVTDRMILRMRDQENRNWGEITKAYVEYTGTQVGGSTLRMRYTTMKANFTSVSDEDGARLLKFKKDIEERFEQEKWHRLAEAIEADGGDKYPTATLQKKYKELSKNGAASTEE
ncbi:hypothetical protein HFD88_003848 [Aspergillus terreus]|nr:hypothetical protein HFD88_003848 [Aspergillus terreus]